jgi:L1 cell adhesion molecule like protein
MERVEARNGLESYLYNARNTLKEDKVKDTLSSEDISSAETAVQEGLDWLSANEEASTEDFKDKQTRMEERIKPVMMKLYGNSSSSGSSEPAAAAAGPCNPRSEEAGPRVEEVD